MSSSTALQVLEKIIEQSYDFGQIQQLSRRQHLCSFHLKFQFLSRFKIPVETKTKVEMNAWRKSEKDASTSRTLRLRLNNNIPITVATRSIDKYNINTSLASTIVLTNAVSIALLGK